MRRFLIWFAILLFVAACKEKETILPVVNTFQPSQITSTSAVYSGEIVTTGNVSIFDYGFVWSTQEMPTTESSAKLFGRPGVVGKFEAQVDNLDPATTYFIRTILTTSEGIQYGEQKKFTTSTISNPQLITHAPPEIAITSAHFKGEIISMGNISILDHGFVWSKTELPTTESNSKLLGKPGSTGIFETTIENLVPFTEYFVRTVLITSSGIIYGNQEKFTTLKLNITTLEAHTITFSTAFLIGQLGDYGSLKINDYGFVWSTSPGVNLVNSIKISIAPPGNSVDFDFKITGLAESTTYYFNTYLLTESGVVYGTEKSFVTAKGPWKQIADFPGTPRTNAIAFTINGKGYVGLGNGEGFIALKDLWEYDPSENKWTRKSDFKGEARSAAVAFSIEGKAYVGTGVYSNIYDDMWEYSPVTDEWVQKSNFPGGMVYYATAFSIGSFGYVGTGIRNGTLLTEFWQYDATLDHWTSKADFEGSPVDVAVGFTIGNIGYIGTGNLQSGSSKEFWAYDASQNQWEQKSYLPTERWNSVGFVLFDRGYIGLGNGSPTDIFWKYDPSGNLWTVGPTFPGGQREGSSAFVINHKAYIGLGAFGKKDFWEYDPIKDTN